MLGPKQRCEGKLFLYGFDLEARIPADHRLRRIRSIVDFDFVRQEVAAHYYRAGRRSHDPVVLLKLMLLLFLENVSSERELAAQLPLRLDWLWFCGFDLDDPLPDHTALSKARRRWGPDPFASFFTRIVMQCVEAGLVDGAVAHADGSLIGADASMDTLRPAWYERGLQLFARLEGTEGAKAGESQGVPGLPGASSVASTPAGLENAPSIEAAEPAAGMFIEPTIEGRADAGPEEQSPSPPDARGAAALDSPALPFSPGRDVDHETSPRPSPVEPEASSRRISPTDPDASLARKYGRSMLGYKDHRMVDDRFGIITATLTTTAIASEADLLMALIASHEQHTQRQLHTIAADAGYGTAENYTKLREAGKRPCIPHQPANEAGPGRFRREQFHYDAQADCYICPAGQRLTRRGAADHGRHRYRAGVNVCRACPLRDQCTGDARGRHLSRHVSQDAIDWADNLHTRSHRRRLLNRRRCVVEGSFADATRRHGYKRSRWRSLERMTIQNLMIALAQNLRKLLRYGSHPIRPQHGVTAALAGASGRCAHRSASQIVLNAMRSLYTASPAPWPH